MSILNENQAQTLSHPILEAETQDGTQAGVPENGMSFVRGSNTKPLLHKTIPQVLRETVARHGQRDAIVASSQNRRLTYYDFDREVDSLAAGFLALGLNKGDRIGIW